MIFHISVALVVLLFLFHFLFCLFGSSLFFLVSLAKSLSILFIFSEKQLLGLLILSTILFGPLLFILLRLLNKKVSIFIFSMILIIFFTLLTLSFVCFLLNLLAGWLDLFEGFVYLLMKAYTATKIHLRIIFAASHRLWSVAFLFSFVSRCFLIFSLIYSFFFFFGSSMMCSVHIFLLQIFFLSLIFCFMLL